MSDSEVQKPGLEKQGPLLRGKEMWDEGPTVFQSDKFPVKVIAFHLEVATLPDVTGLRPGGS